MVSPSTSTSAYPVPVALITMPPLMRTALMLSSSETGRVQPEPPSETGCIDRFAKSELSRRTSR